MGLRVPDEDTFARLLPLQLLEQTGRKVEIYNESIEGTGGIPPTVDNRIDEALNVKPDLILWVLTPWDLENAARSSSTVVHAEAECRSGCKVSAMARAQTVLSGVVHSARDLWTRTRTNAMVRHYLYQSRTLYMHSYFSGPDETNGFLKTTPSPLWQSRLQGFESYFADVEQQARAAGVPVMVTLVPNRAQAAMISMGQWPSGFDPYKLDNELRLIVDRNGGTYVEISSAFRDVPNAESHYFPLDGHPDSDAHRIISTLLAKQIAGGTVPPLTVSAAKLGSQEQGR
jgi:hypothetical protein